MSGRQHRDPARQARHAAGQRKIVHYCSCGLLVRGNPGWASHLTAAWREKVRWNRADLRTRGPEPLAHYAVTRSTWDAMQVPR